MPVYLCQSGAGEAEPWRFGIQVYSAPFDVNDASPQPGQGGGRDLVVASWTPGQPETASEHRVAPGHPIRRIRHAETVLVDDVCISHGRYWLRLRWPGHKGGFSGYVAMQKVSEVDKGEFRMFRGSCVFSSALYVNSPRAKKRVASFESTLPWKNVLVQRKLKTNDRRPEACLLLNHSMTRLQRR